MVVSLWSGGLLRAPVAQGNPSSEPGPVGWVSKCGELVSKGNQPENLQRTSTPRFNGAPKGKEGAAQLQQLQDLQAFLNTTLTK